LTEFLTDKKNIELLKELSNSNFNNNILPETNFDINLFQEKLDNAGLIFSPQLIQRFIASLCTKPFVICSGLSGSGKTKLAQAFAQWICYKEEDGEKNEQYCIVPVGADWTNREPLLGYPNALKKEEYVSPENGVLDLMVRAKQNIENTEEPTKPYFLILDEMNLSHVERYFADFLSTMESGDTIPLHKILPESTKHLITIPQTLKLPKNLFIIGTVNIDETTYMFSPKVLDRANTIEFRLTEKNLEDFIASDIKLDMKLLKAQGANMSDSFMAMALQETDKNLKPSEADLKLFFSELKKSGAEFGYRTASEIGRLMYMLNELGESGDNLLDIAIMQKLLPKLHGSRNKLTKVLPILGGFCLTDNSKIKEDYLDKFVSNSLTEVELEADTNIKYKISFEKICRMYKNAVENGFASYAEA
jgi:5-methylcytosine-specific restriction endonuclease McrBC GTP-binding regulatory subunit McrB